MRSKRAWMLWVTLGCVSCDPPSEPAPAPLASERADATAPSARHSASAATSTRPASAPPTAASVEKAVPKSEAAGRYAKLSDEDVAKLVKPHLAKSETVAHPPFQGPYGPSQDTIVVITKKENEDFGGFVLVTHAGTTERKDLPTLQESWPGISVEAIGFVPECDGDSVEELVVISQHRSAKLPATVVSVIDFDGKVFSRLQDVELLAVKAKTVAEVRETLSTSTFVMHIDSVPVRMAPTIRPDALQERLEKLMGVAAKSASDTELAFDYGEKMDTGTASFGFAFNDAKVLQSITVAAKGTGDTKAEGLNPTARKLVAWLEKNVGAGTKAENKTTWEHNRWVFVLDQGAAGDEYALVVTPAK